MIPDIATISRVAAVGADFRSANLQDCSLEWSDLSMADLSNANLRGCKLNEILLSGALLRNTDLSGADLSQAIGCTRKQLLSAKTDTSTKLPEPVAAPQTANSPNTLFRQFQYAYNSENLPLLEKLIDPKFREVETSSGTTTYTSRDKWVEIRHQLFHMASEVRIALVPADEQRRRSVGYPRWDAKQDSIITFPVNRYWSYTIADTVFSGTSRLDISVSNRDDNYRMLEFVAY